MKKLLHERLRELKGRGCSELASLAGVSCQAYCVSDACHKDIYKAIADEIEKYYIPRPRFEDGEPVQSSDMEEIGGLATCRVYTDGSWHFNPDKYEDERNPKPRDEQTGRQCDCIKRPEPKVLCEFEGEYYNFDVDKLTHREPDSLKKLHGDMLKWLCRPAHQGEAVERWANRLAAIMERDA